MPTFRVKVTNGKILVPPGFDLPDGAEVEVTVINQSSAQINREYRGGLLELIGAAPEFYGSTQDIDAHVRQLRDEHRIAETISDLLDSNVHKDLLYHESSIRLRAINPVYDYTDKVANRSLNIAINFFDSYFDALGHNFEDCAGIPMPTAKVKLFHILAMLRIGQEITDPDLDQFYYPPK